MPYFVYALYSEYLDSIYIGQTSNLEKRLHDHQKGYSKYTSRAADWKLIYSEEVSDRSAAMKRERQLKSFRGREYIYSVIRKENL